MNQEHRVDYDVVKRACDDIAFEMNLPMDRFAVRTRDNYIKAIYNSCYQCVTPYNEMAYKWVNSTINGNLASWYANEYSIYKNAPMEWQKDVKETIVEMFKESYTEREDLKEDYEEYGLPTSFSVLLSDAEKEEMADSEDEEEFVSDYITNKYGFCHNGFTYEIVGDELIVDDVQWDIDEEDEFDDDELEENLTQDSISGDSLMQEVYDFIISESNEDRLVPFDVVRNMMNERGLRLEDYFNDLLIRDGQEGLLLKTIDGDQYIGPVSLLDKRSDEVAIVKKEEQKLEKSVNRLQDKIDGEIAAERKWLEDATYGDIDELVDNVKYIYVEAPRARKYQPLIRKLFGQDADKVHITKSDNPNAKWSISADIYIKDVDKLPAAIKAKVNSNGTISSIGLAVELYRAGAKLSGSKEVKESCGAHLLKEAKDPVQRRYKSMSKAKWASLGETMTLKDALDLWWNSVRIDGEIYYKTHTGNYETPEDDIPEELLNRKITLWNEYDNDSDGYPIVYADWSEELKEAKDIKDKMYVGIWDDAQDDFVEYKEFNDFQDALEFASKYDYSKIKSGTVKFDTNSLFTKGFASEFAIVNGKTDLKAMQELMPKKEVNESLQLTEGHIEQQYKGFTLDWNDDGVDPEEGTADFSVRIYFNGEEITQDAYGKELSFNGFAAAKRWIDKYLKENQLEFFNEGLLYLQEEFQFQSPITINQDIVDLIDSSSIDWKITDTDVNEEADLKMRQVSMIPSIENGKFTVFGSITDWDQDTFIVFEYQKSADLPITMIEDDDDVGLVNKSKLNSILEKLAKDLEDTLNGIQQNEQELKEDMEDNMLKLHTLAGKKFLSRIKGGEDPINILNKIELLISNLKSAAIESRQMGHKNKYDDFMSQARDLELDYIKIKNYVDNMQQNISSENVDDIKEQKLEYPMESKTYKVTVDETLKESYDDWEESGIYGGDLTYCPICDTRLKYDEDGDHYCPKCKEDAHSLSMKRRHLMKESKVSPLDRAVEIYTTMLNPYGNLNSPFDDEEDYIEDLKDTFKNKKYAEYFISEYEDDDDVKSQEFVSLLKHIHSIKEAVDPTRAKEVKKNSDAWAVLYGYKFRNEPEVELEPEEHDEKSLRERINEIVSSYNGKGNRPSKNAKETDFIFYVLYR